ncbi:MAG: GIY-YIG nuclease family protein [Patescibacteria group bacterium]
MYFLYILKCSDNSLYTGITTDLDRRFLEHKLGKGGHYTRSRKVLRVVYTEKQENRSVASKREAEVKKLSKLQKLGLVKTYKKGKLS